MQPHSQLAIALVLARGRALIADLLWKNKLQLEVEMLRKFDSPYELQCVHAKDLFTFSIWYVLLLVSRSHRRA